MEYYITQEEVNKCIKFNKNDNIDETKFKNFKLKNGKKFNELKDDVLIFKDIKISSDEKFILNNIEIKKVIIINGDIEYFGIMNCVLNIEIKNATIGGIFCIEHSNIENLLIENMENNLFIIEKSFISDFKLKKSNILKILFKNSTIYMSSINNINSYYLLFYNSLLHNIALNNSSILELLFYDNEIKNINIKNIDGNLLRICQNTMKPPLLQKNNFMEIKKFDNKHPNKFLNLFSRWILNV